MVSPLPFPFFYSLRLSPQPLQCLVPFLSSKLTHRILYHNSFLGHVGSQAALGKLASLDTLLELLLRCTRTENEVSFCAAKGAFERPNSRSKKAIANLLRRACRRRVKATQTSATLGRQQLLRQQLDAALSLSFPCV